MNEIGDFFGKLFSSADWPPRWHCGKWTEFQGWLYIISDLLIWSAYFAIPIIIIRYISKRKGAHFPKAYFLFAAFILACGSTHFLDALAFWFPVYRLSALVRFITGIVSWVTVFSLIRILPKAFSLRSPKALEEEVARRTQELVAANLQLQKFAYVASHDLKEPLRKIITFTSHLKADLKEGIVSKNTMIYMDKIVSSSLRMQKLIGDIQSFSKLNAGEDVSTPCDLNVVLQQVLSNMEVIIEKTASSIQIEPLPQIEANSSQIGQLFQNLLANAIKFRIKDTIPQIQVKAVLTDGSKLSQEDAGKLTRRFPDSAYVKEKFCKISVSDNGIGFDESYLDRVFDIFQRLHGTAAYEGTGIGLAICKKIVDNHRGLITAISKPGEGSTFVILLPYQSKGMNGNLDTFRRKHRVGDRSLYRFPPVLY